MTEPRPQPSLGDGPPNGVAGTDSTRADSYPASADLAGLIMDYGGVLTTALHDCLTAYCEADDMDYGTFRAAMRDWLGPAGAVTAAVNPAHALERGELAVPDFEQALAARLRTRDGRPVAPDGLLGRMRGFFRREPMMPEVVRTARRAGIRTALLSNSWGLDYPRDDWEELFDAVVISGEVGMRKPEAAIFLHTAELLGLPPGRCAFVDDLPDNVRGAVPAGMVGVRHVTVAETVAELEVLFGLPLAPAAP